MVWIVYIDMEKTDHTAGIFATYPRLEISMWQGKEGYKMHKLKKIQL